ncbi:bidirectional sugar transporter SWEET [Chloropicon roscoffensis]|uniref:Bidirectional sugar transporter SWEET n=1 Tax=Chloropicon roscoffensis TaxID=1461544 RepID=A0AAX4P6H3_9CHLO
MSSAGVIVTKWVAPLFGVIIANLMFATPMRAVLQAKRDGDLGSLNPVPWPAITGNCMAWIGYSYYKRDWFVYAANQPGFIMGVFYSLTAIGLAKRDTRDVLVYIFLALCLLLPSVAVVLNLGLGDHADQETKSFVWGLLCNAILVVYYSAPLSTLVQVVKTKSAESLHWPSCTMNLINGTCWVAYGFAIQDYFILSPNVAGVFLSIVQLTLVAVYKSNDEAGRQMSTRTFFFPSRSTLGAEEGGGHAQDSVVINRSNSQQRLVDGGDTP